jgi:hypothetical protein
MCALISFMVFISTNRPFGEYTILNTVPQPAYINTMRYSRLKSNNTRSASIQALTAPALHNTVFWDRSFLL